MIGEAGEFYLERFDCANMTGKVNERMQGMLHVRFFEKEKLLFEGTGRNAGLEIAGQVAELLTEKWRR